MPGRPSDSRSRVTGGVITPRSSAISGSSPRTSRAASNGARPGPRFQEPDKANSASAGTAQKAREAAEVVDPRQVEELEDALEARDPPRVALTTQRRPVVQGVAPQLALVGEDVGRDAGDGARLEDLGVRELVGRLGRDVDRDVADQLHAALLGVRPQRGPLAVEADLVIQSVLARERQPVLDPVGGAFAEIQALGSGNRGRGRAEQLRRGGERRRRFVGRVVLVGRAQRQHLPPRLAGRGQPVDPGVGVRTEPSGGQRRGVQLDP